MPIRMGMTPRLVPLPGRHPLQHRGQRGLQRHLLPQVQLLYRAQLRSRRLRGEGFHIVRSRSRILRLRSCSVTLES